MFRLQDDMIRFGNQGGYRTGRYSFASLRLGLLTAHCRDVVCCMRAGMVCPPETDIVDHRRQDNTPKSRD